MTALIGNHDSFWLVVVLLVLALGLAAALFTATRDGFKATRAGSPAPIRGRRPR
jgi:hypothetical protein